MKNFKRLIANRLSITLFVLGATLIGTTIIARTALTQSSATPAVLAKAEARIDGASVGGGKTVPPETKPAPLAGKQGMPAPNAPENTANYAFATATNASLTDMSTGTTQLLGANIDDTASALSNIGFDFYFQGARFTQFSINDNGVVRLGATAQTSTPYKPLAQAGISIITAYGADQRTHAGDGKVHFKVIGTAPNRVLVIEWLNNQANFNTGGTADLTYQVRLSETTGVIEFVYGSMTMSTLGAASVDSRDPHIGFSSTNTAGNVGSVTAAQGGAPAPTFNGASATPVANLYTAGAITVLTSASQGSRRSFTFTPPTPTAPTALNFTGVTQLAMTLNWTDSPDELLYAVYRSTDNVNFVFDGTAAQNAISYAASGLSPGVTYFWRVFAVSEGALSTALAGSQATAAAGNILSTGAGGNWSLGTTWVGGNVPGPGDNATIVTGATVTIDSSNCLNLTVQTGGTLQYEATTARTLTVGQSATIDSGGVFQSATTGTQTGHVLSVGADLTNNGTIDFSTSANTAAAGIVFTGATDAAFMLGAASTTDLKQTAGVTLNKGTNNTPVLTFTPGGTLTVLGANAVGFLSITNGTFKLSGANTFSNPVFNVAGYAIPATGGFWMNNTNATVVAQNGTGTVTGLFRMTLGTFNLGTGAGSALAFASGANINIEGGAINSSGRVAVTASGNAITYNQTGGTITVCTVGNTSTTLASFDLGTGVGTTNISGGTIVVQLANTAVSGPRDYRNQSGLTGTTTVTGGTVQMGNAASGGAKAFSIAGVLPNLVLNNASAGHSTTFLAPAVFNNITLNVTINIGNLLNVGNNVFLMNGTTFTNDGTLTANGASTNFVWFLTTSPQSYTGSGVVTAPMTNMAIQADMGLTISLASPNIVVGAIRLFSGSLFNSNKITLGNGAATTGIVQIGNTTTPTAAGTFDVPFTFNLGTGGETISYLRTTASRSTGPEVNPTRTLTTLTIDDNDATHTLTIAGGDITVTGNISFVNERVITGANVLVLGGAGTAGRTNGYVDGNFRKTYAAAANKSFEVGTANAFSPVTVNITSGTFPAVFTVKAVQGPQPNILSPTHALQRYWVLTGTGVTADLTFTYASDAIDVPVTAQESFFVILKFDGGFTAPGGTVNTGANTASITGVTSFGAAGSDWTLAEPNAPTAVALASMTATEYDTGTHVQWQTGAEVRNLGFNIYRDAGGKRTQVNPQLIAGGALLAGSDTVLKSGKSYSWWINSASGKSAGQLWLEDVDLSGQSTWHGPIGARRVGGSPPSTSDAALLSRVGVAESQAGSSVQVKRSAALTRVAPGQIKLQTDLAGKQAVKISVRREGWYRVSQADLLAAGFNGKADPQTIQVYADGRQIPISVITNQKQISAVDFYGRGIEASHTDARVYWLVAGAQAGLRVQQVRGEGYPAASRSFLYTVERKERTIYFSALRNGEKENFFGPVIAMDPVDQTLNLQHVDQASTGQAQLEVALQGVTQLPHRVWAYLNGTFAGELLFNGQAEGVAKLPVSQSLLREGDNQVRLVAQGGPGDVSLVGFVRLGYFHGFTADNNALRFTATGGQAVTIDGFGSGAIRVLDVTDPDRVEEVVGKVEEQKAGGYSITVASPQAGERVLLAGIDDERGRPARVVDNRPSNLRSAEHGANLVIIANRDMLSSVEPLRAKRASQGFKVEVVDVEDIFDEFSFGNKSPDAVRDFLLYTQSGWKLAPQYVLLVGDASLDPKGYLGYVDSDLAPTMLIDTALMETASDDGLADFNGDGMPELALGRLPVRTAEEAARMIGKIVGYDQSGPVGSVMLVADGNDGFDFEAASRDLASLVPGNIKVDVLNRGELNPETARAQLIDAINRGQKVINYLGHGSVNVWRGGLLTNEDAAAMVNGRLPLFVMMTCLNGYFQDPALDSLAESLMKSRGGAVAVWASSGMTGPDGQAAIDRQVFELIFRSSNIKGQALTLGEATLRAKRAVNDIDVRRTYILFGDPSTRLR